MRDLRLTCPTTRRSFEAKLDLNAKIACMGGKTMKRKRFMNGKVDADVVRKAKVVAAAKYTTLTSYVTALLRSHVEKDMAVVAS